MHLTDKSGDSSSTMSVLSGGIGLRRQPPVSSRPPVRPPRLRLGTSGTRTMQLHKQLKSLANPAVENGNQETSSDSSFILSSGKSNPTKVDKDRSRHLISSCQMKRRSLSVDSSLNSSRPLIHHQRHNLKNRFQLTKTTLGEGTYGKVKLAVDRTTGEQVAIKYIKKTKIHDDADLARIRREIQILSSLRHKHIVNIREVFEKKDKIVLVMDYAQGGELYEYLNKLGKLEEKDARRVFRQIVSAIHYCHQNGVVHRDLKLENIILDDEGDVKIADFGLSNYYSHNETLRTFCGSPLYASPEIVNGKPYHGPEVDVWSLGVILYTLVYGAMPFESSSLASLKQQISDGDYTQPPRPSDAAGLIRHMLTVTPSRRATIEDALRHWWVNFGHAHMPNDAPYSPDDEPPVMAYTLTPDPFPEPQVIHQRNQSSLSSDSDVELDFRPSRWSTRRRAPLDSTGSSLSSSVGGSPAPTPDSGCLDNSDDPAAIASGLLKLPPDVLDILKGCSSKSLAALLNQAKISTGFDSDLDSVSHSGTSNSILSHDEFSKPLISPDAEKLSPTSSVFDSERKPARSILKRKGKFSGGDSGCRVNEDMAAAVTDETPIPPKSGHLPRRMPSFKEEANGVFAGKHRAAHLLENPSHQRESWGCSPQTLMCHSPNPNPHQCSSENNNQSPHELPDSCNHHCQNHLPLPEYQNQDALQISQQQHRNPPHQVTQHHNPQNNFQQTKEPHQHSQSHTQSHIHKQHQPYQHNISNDTNGHVQNNVSKPGLNSNHVLNNYPLEHQSKKRMDSIDFMSTGHLSAAIPAPVGSHCIHISGEKLPLHTQPLHKSTSQPVMQRETATSPVPQPMVKSKDSSSGSHVPKIIHVKQLSDSQTSKIVWRPKSILKNYKPSQMEEARNRLSISSIGSNSSADILDLSYDSGDSDHFVNMAFEIGREFSSDLPCPNSDLPCTKIDVRAPDMRRIGRVWTDDHDQTWSQGHSDQKWSCDQRNGGQPWSFEITERSPENISNFEGVSVNSESLNGNEGREILDLDNSSILYRLTREAKGLL